MQFASALSAFLGKDWQRHASVHMLWHVGIAVSGVVLVRLLGTITQIVLARLMGLTNFGVYTALYTLLGPAFVLAVMGLDTWLLRKGGERETLPTTISQVFSLRLLVIAILTVLSVALVLWTNQEGFAPLLVIFAALSLACELLLTTAATALRSQVRNVAAAWLQISVAGLTLLLIVLFWNAQAPVFTATGYRLLAALCGLALMLWLLRHTLRLIWRPAPLRIRCSASPASILSQTCWAMPVCVQI
ncbi:MAG: oligosaccharide flippase family protein [Chloroflexaceae bacterium]|nr:oligosaccharide flippase family protein [Chloroflexaceae bacterium]